jgi:hypothetical protein
MNNQTPTTEGLDEQERELARIVRALPGGEPSAALDARILKAAGNAAATSRRPRTRWLASAGAMWGIGAAAAAVLALGVSWQLMVPAHRSMQPEAAPAASMEDRAEDSAVSVELKEQQAVESENAPAPASERTTAATGATAESQARPAPPPPGPPPPPAPPIAAMPSTAMPEPFAAETPQEPVAASVQAAPAAKAAMEAQMSQRAAAKSELATGPAADAAAVGMLNGTSEAAPMQTGDWLAHIRRLRDQDRPAEARASLLEFRKRYPDFAIPPDLAPLLRE